MSLINRIIIIQYQLKNEFAIITGCKKDAIFYNVIKTEMNTTEHLYNICHYTPATIDKLIKNELTNNDNTFLLMKDNIITDANNTRTTKKKLISIYNKFNSPSYLIQ